MLIVLPDCAWLTAYPMVLQAFVLQAPLSLPVGDTYKVRPAPMARPGPGAATRLMSNAHSTARRRRGERAIECGCRSNTVHPSLSHGNPRSIAPAPGRPYAAASRYSM